MSTFDCMNCGRDTFDEYYMVHNHLWSAALLPVDAETSACMLCISCLEKRLNRQLTAADFTDAPINSIPPTADGWFRQKSPLLIKRLTAVNPW
jgi:hypothetical protein